MQLSRSREQRVRSAARARDVYLPATDRPDGLDLPFDISSRGRASVSIYLITGGLSFIVLTLVPTNALLIPPTDGHQPGQREKWERERELAAPRDCKRSKDFNCAPRDLYLPQRHISRDNYRAERNDISGMIVSRSRRMRSQDEIGAVAQFQKTYCSRM